MVCMEKKKQQLFNDKTWTTMQIRELFYLTLYTWFNVAATRHINGLPNFMSFLLI